MRSWTLSSATATLLAARAYAGQAIVQNNCGGDVSPWVWSVGVQPGPGHQLTAGASSYSEAFRARSDNAGGISIKIANKNDISGAVAQFEYTLSNWGGNNVFYDLSNINGNPFKGTHYQLKASDPNCPVVDCPATADQCSAAYNQPDDNTATHMCSASADLTLTFCPDGSSKSSSSSSSGSSPSQQQSNSSPAQAPSSPTPSPASTPAASPVPQPPLAIPQGQGSSSSSSQGSSSKGNSPAAAAKVATGSDSSNSNSNSSPAPASSPSTTMVVVNADGSVREVDTLPAGAVLVNKVKRDEHGHSHAHSQLHERLRRSRIFRRAASHL